MDGQKCQKYISEFTNWDMAIFAALKFWQILSLRDKVFFWICIFRWLNLSKFFVLSPQTAEWSLSRHSTEDSKKPVLVQESCISWPTPLSPPCSSWAVYTIKYRVKHWCPVNRWYIKVLITLFDRYEILRAGELSHQLPALVTIYWAVSLVDSWRGYMDNHINIAKTYSFSLHNSRNLQFV